LKINNKEKYNTNSNEYNKTNQINKIIKDNGIKTELNETKKNFKELMEQKIENSGYDASKNSAINHKEQTLPMTTNVKLIDK